MAGQWDIGVGRREALGKRHERTTGKSQVVQRGKYQKNVDAEIIWHPLTGQARI